MNKPAAVSGIVKKDVVITRRFDAPVELVWRAWTDPEFVKRWWGPKDYISPFCRVDLREGGTYLFGMRAPDYQGGQDFYSTGVYKKIVPMQYLEFTQVLSDKDGNKISPADIGMPADFPDEVRTVIVFKALGSQTEITITEYNWTVGQMRDYSELGMNQSLDKLADSLKIKSNPTHSKESSMATNTTPKSAERNRTNITAEPGMPVVLMTREFDAPRELVFKAFTDPELYVQWLGPHGYKMKLEKFEPRFGGVWRYIHHDKDGNEFAFRGVYHEVSAPERIINTFEYEGLPEPGHVILETATFEALPGGRTRLNNLSVFQSVGDRDGMLQSGMESGMNESYEKLSALLEKMQQ